MTTTLIDGATPDQLGNWDAKIAELSGGAPAVEEAFNHASRAAAEEQVTTGEDRRRPG